MNTILLTILFISASQQHSLPPHLLMSICYTETRFNPDAIHHDDGNGDSLGICQIKLTTAKMLGFQGTDKQLMLPKTNIEYAAKYLKWQLTRYHYNVGSAIIAYNQGKTKVLTHTKYSDKVFKYWKELDNE